MNATKDAIKNYFKTTASLSEAEAEKVYDYYVEHKLVRIDGVGNGWTFSHGSYGDKYRFTGNPCCKKK